MTSDAFSAYTSNLVRGEKSRRLLSTFIGVCVIIGVLALCSWFYVTQSYSHRHASYIVHVVFNRVDGLVVGQDVKVHGVKVGSVESINLDTESYQVIVRCRLNRSVQLAKDSMAEIASEGLLGGRYVSLVPGGDDVFLKDGERITRAQNSMTFEDMIRHFVMSDNRGNKAQD